MKFILHEIKLWFEEKDSEPKSYNFLPNKINVITGDATTGKTSFWSIIDYCLLSGRIMIPNTINNIVQWFGIRFTINENEISIVRKSPSKGAVASEVCFSQDGFPPIPEQNIDIAELKAILDEEFGITDSLRFPYGKEYGKTSFNLSYRHFLIFNALTESIIGERETFFDTTFFGKDEYDNALSYIFDLVIGVNDMEKIKAQERLNEIDKELKQIIRQEKSNQTRIRKFEQTVNLLVEKCKRNSLIENNISFETADEAVIYIDKMVSETKKVSINSKLFEEIDSLTKERTNLLTKLNAINRYHREFLTYTRNLKKSADSLKPIDFLQENLSDQLVNSYETQAFVDSLAVSLKTIKQALPKKHKEPIKIDGDTKELQTQINKLTAKIEHLGKIKKNYQKIGQQLFALGEIKNTLRQIYKMPGIKSIDTVKLNSLNTEKSILEKVPSDNKVIKGSLKRQLNASIQRNYDLLNSLPAYEDGRIEFNDAEMLLQLFPHGEMFPLDNVGSKSNYMFLHLCLFLGLHEHILNVEQIHVPQFLFIDQPSIPYYSGNEYEGNDDKSKLLDAFSLLNSFIDYVVNTNKNQFQIFMVEHASKDYWIDNKLNNFHTVDEFINGKGLVPNSVYKS
jgi:hypothetical protein